MKKVIVYATEKGASVKSNKWIEGSEIKTHPKIAEQLIEKGFASEEAPKSKPKKSV